MVQFVLLGLDQVPKEVVVVRKRSVVNQALTSKILRAMNQRNKRLLSYLQVH